MKHILPATAIVAGLGALSFFSACSGAVTGPDVVANGPSVPVPVPWGSQPTTWPPPPPTPRPSTGGGGGAATPTPSPEPTPTPTPGPLVTDLAVASGNTYEVCVAQQAGDCAKVYVDADWIATFGTGSTVVRIRTFDSDAGGTATQFLQFTLTRTATVLVFFNSTLTTPDETLTCDSSVPGWANTASWSTTGLGTLTAERPGDPGTSRGYSSRSRAFAAGATVTLGPNTIPNCGTFTPGMYSVVIQE